MNKFDRIQILKVLGLNTEQNVLVSSKGDWDKHHDFLRRFSKYSVSTFKETPYGRGAPHFPIISRFELEQRLQDLLKDGLNLIIAAPIDPKDAELAGCLLHNAGTVSAEVALGPGTVR